MSEKKKGRPTKYTQRIADCICARLVMGESIREITAKKHFPSQRTIYYWLAKNEAFLQQYTLAREVQQERFYEECLEIADDATNDWMERHDKEGNIAGYQLNGEHVQRSRLRIETRRWMMERMAAKRYGKDKPAPRKDPIGDMSREQLIEKLTSMGITHVES